MKKEKGIAPLLLLIAANVLGIWIMFQREELTQDVIVLFIGMCVISVLACMLLTTCDMGDPYLFLIATMLSTIGVIILLSINDMVRTMPKLGGFEAIDHMKMYLIGVALFFITILLYRMFYKHLARLTPIYFSLMMGLYLLTMIMNKIAENNNEDASTRGAGNWITIPGLGSVQPSEFIKVLFVLTIAGILAYTRKKKADNPEKKRYSSTFGVKLAKKTHITRRIMLITAMVYLNMLFLALQSELGTILVMFLTLIAVLFVYDKNKIFLIGNVLLCSVIIIVSTTFIGKLADMGVPATKKIEERILSWSDPMKENPDKDAEYGYQVLRSLDNVSNGGYYGSGIVNAGSGQPGTVNKFDSIHCDFIFSVVCNEMGILGGVGVLLLYFVLIYRGFKIAISTTNEFNKALAFGISTMLSLQTFVIVGGVINLIPITGITLPFVSDGGSSMMSTFIMLGMLQAISSVKGDTTDEIE